MILVTGASGFLGLQLLQELIARQKPVRAIYNSTVPQLQHPLIQWEKADLLDIFAVEHIFRDVTHVYHCAAIVSFDSAHKEALIQNNIHVTAHVVNQALEQGIDKMIYVSSIAAMGRSQTAQFIDEETFWTESRENSTYSKSKYYAEMEVWRGIAEGLNAAIVNPAIILGEGDYSRGSAQLMSNVAKEFPYYTEGVNGWVDVKDVARAMVLLMDSDISEERFILSTGNYSYREVFTLMAEKLSVRPPSRHATPFLASIVWRLDYLRSRITGKNPLITRESARTARNRCYYDNSKFLEAFPAFEYTPLSATIERMASDFKDRTNRGKP